MSTILTGWLFDVYPCAKGVVLWFIDPNGAKHRCVAPFLPSFFMQISPDDAQRAKSIASQLPGQISFAKTTRLELFSNKELDVVQLFVHDATRFQQVVRYYEKFFPHFVFFNSDILPSQLFLYETQLFPLGYGEYEISNEGELVQWTLSDSWDACEYTLPPLSMMMVRNANDFVPPKYRKTIHLEITYDSQTYTIELDSPREVIESLNWHLSRHDPDIILTEYGDATLMPLLTNLAEQSHFPLLLNRDVQAAFKISRESSFFQYGKVIHKDGAFELRGRWHIDAKNSFTLAEANLDGLFELIRVTQLCPQHQARASIGTGLSSLQLSWAYRNNILIPSKKREPEEFKSAATLLLSDRGGLIYQPPIGYHEDVAELDFVSMYPSIMVNHNVSPETINCRCCTNTLVPDLMYTICQKREGIVPATLRSIVAKRAYYKKKKKEFKGKNQELFLRYESRQSSLKWMLVSCFGYLGYKNARFGKIEAHESVNAISRDAILTAKEVAEEHGYKLIHAIIDCVWLKKEGATEQDYEQLCDTIGKRVGIDISLEGIYKWILFPPSKMDPVLPTANRYVGVYKNGDTKMRGIETRRRDTCKFVKELQYKMLDRMFTLSAKEELRALVPELLDIAENAVKIILSGKVNPMDLVLHRHITKEADEYMNNSISAVVSKLLKETGIHISPGESIDYIILDASGRRKPEKAKPLALYAFEDGYDIEKYVDLALEAAETLLEPFGYTKAVLNKTLECEDKSRINFQNDLFDPDNNNSRFALTYKATV